MIPISDPQILNTGFPWIVLANNSNDWVAKLINFKTHISGIQPINHAMLSIEMDEFVVENMTLFNAYKVIPMVKYMIPGQILIFANFVNSNPDFVSAFSASVQSRLDRPGWENTYDFLGIVGQAINCPWIHSPGLEFCSVDVIRHSVNACPKLPKADQMVINGIPRETNPERLYQIILNNPATFNVYGIYQFPMSSVVSLVPLTQ